MRKWIIIRGVVRIVMTNAACHDEIINRIDAPLDVPQLDNDLTNVNKNIGPARANLVSLVLL